MKTDSYLSAETARAIRAKLRECYTNSAKGAAHLDAEKVEGVLYVEGVAAVPGDNFALNHAWIECNGDLIVDPTWVKILKIETVIYVPVRKWTTAEMFGFLMGSGEVRLPVGEYVLNPDERKEYRRLIAEAQQTARNAVIASLARDMFTPTPLLETCKPANVRRLNPDSTIYAARNFGKRFAVAFTPANLAIVAAAEDEPSITGYAEFCTVAAASDFLQSCDGLPEIDAARQLIQYVNLINGLSQAN